jgi:hypothetical protein
VQVEPYIGRRVSADGARVSLALSLAFSLSLSRGSSDEFRSRLHFDFIFNKLFTNRWTPRACRGVIHDAHSLARLHRHACVLVVYF